MNGSALDEGGEDIYRDRLDRLDVTAFALAKSICKWTSSLKHSDGERERESLDGAWLETFRGRCSNEDVNGLDACVKAFLVRYPVVPGTDGAPPRQDKNSPPCLREDSDIQRSWEQIFERRRRQESDDSKPINDNDVLSRMWMAWQYEWLDCNLTRQQCGIAADGSQTRKSQTRSYFNAFVNREFGGKNWSALQHRQMTAGRRSDVLCRSAPPPRALQPRLPGPCGVDQPQPSTVSHEAPFGTSSHCLLYTSPSPRD